MPANPPYMRCSKLDKLNRITYPALIQRKMDGMFANIIVRNGEVTFITRQGEVFELPTFKDRFASVADNVVFMGEVVVCDDEGNEIDRETSNGYMNRLLQMGKVVNRLMNKGNELFAVEAQEREDYQWIWNHATIHLWDIADYDAWNVGEFTVPYIERYSLLHELGLGDLAVETLEVYSEEEAFAVANQYINAGYEGAVLKNMNAPWKNHDSPNQIKLKREEECDLIVKDWVEGTGKYKGMMGALICESSDGRVRTRVGTGFDDSERMLTHEYVGMVINVKYEKVSRAKGSSTYSLTGPARFVEIRTERTVADDFERISTKQKVVTRK